MKETGLGFHPAQPHSPLLKAPSYPFGSWDPPGLQLCAWWGVGVLGKQCQAVRKKGSDLTRSGTAWHTFVWTESQAEPNLNLFPGPNL